ncbi:xylulokinase [Amnibacterium endophyticum]|uniref:Xylulokinase n=1 Tax=Amnibacterium endophyticum TaxID=2109337 RepID=A0ABW4LFU4_9MICO
MDAADVISSGRAVLGIELGSTRIKACLIAEDARTVLATGAADWENRFVDRLWTYSLDDVTAGLQHAYADLAEDVEHRHGVTLESLAGVGVSAMMHGYLAFDADGELLVPFRTWRNTSTGRAAAELTEAFGVNIPMRWSVAHLYQAVLDGEEHVGRVASITTLAGHVHRLLTGEDVLGVGDASGMFPIRDGAYDEDLLARFDALADGRVPPLAELLPAVLPAGRAAGTLTEDGAELLDPSGVLTAGAVAAPPEGDAGTGMVATDSVGPREGNVSVGTSVFAMVVLEGPLSSVHHEIDLVTTPAGDPVAMVHCNNGASELGAWAAMFRRFAEAAGTPLDADRVFEVLFREAAAGEADAGGVLAYNLLSGEPVAGLDEGRPLVVRTPDSRLTLANLMRAQVHGVFGTLALGMRVLAGEGVRVDRLLAHGGLFRTQGLAERFLAGALDVPVVTGETAAEGGAWGMAVLAAYAASGAETDLRTFLADRVFAGADFRTTRPEEADVRGFAAYLDRYEAGLALERAAVTAL